MGAIFIIFVIISAVIAWFLFSKHVLTTRSFNRIIHNYYILMLQGGNHDDILTQILHFEFPNSVISRGAILSSLDQYREETPPGENEVLTNYAELTYFVYFIFCHKNGIPPTKEYQNKILSEIIDINYAKMAAFINYMAKNANNNEPFIQFISEKKVDNICPACGFDMNKAIHKKNDECPKCRIIISKYRKAKPVK